VALKVLHPSVFKVTVELPNMTHPSEAGPLSTFVLKAECRPALDTDGQQGVGEVGVAAVLEAVFGYDGAYGAYGWINAARGVVVELTADMLTNILSRGDSCGLVSGDWSLWAAGVPRDRRQGFYYVGAAMQWNPIHYDDAVPHDDVLEYFRLPRLDEANFSRYRGHGPLHPALYDPAEREALRQLSDVVVVDYLTQSSDRTDHNWFRVAGAVKELAALEELEHNATEDSRVPRRPRRSFAFPSRGDLTRSPTAKRARQRSGKHFDVVDKPNTIDMNTRTSRFLHMDNGWGFAGLGFVDSICDESTYALEWPRLLMHLNDTCGSAGALACHPPRTARPPLPFCRFRNRTVVAVNDLARRWTGSELAVPSHSPTTTAVNATASTASSNASDCNNSTASHCSAGATSPPTTTSLPATTAPPTPVPAPLGYCAEWADVLRADPLVQFLLRRFSLSEDVRGGQPRGRGRGNPLNVVLSRFVHDCPAIGGNGVRDVIDQLAYGVGRRLRALAEHVQWCVDVYGADEVLL
jgi:hypothetical protein